MKLDARIATLDDLDILNEFQQALITVERPMDASLRQTGLMYYYDLAELITAKESDVMVVCHQGEIVGSGYGLIKAHERDIFVTKHYGYIGFMYVKEAYRGQGVGQLVLKKLVEWFKERDITDIRLEVYDNNPGAIKAYQKAGFQSHLIEMQLKVE
ncbi:MAG TPA: GNAT family N-acetyltransferase [Microscillaceae bacterium]|nr:GNAT family N-acetyltransferase [Microscillaceae bacterium]